MQKWISPKIFPHFLSDEIHLWLTKIEPSFEKAKAFLDFLSPDEKMRAQRFHFEKDKIRFITTRGNLRVLLSQYLNCLPDEVFFTYGTHGKPLLKNNPDLHFNVTHSHNVAMFAFSKSYELGIDIEIKDDTRSIDRIAERFFTTNESQLVHQLTQEKKSTAFFNLWVCKEAFIKALGRGLSYPLKNIEINDPFYNPSIIILNDPSLDSKQWNVTLIETFANFSAALVTKGLAKGINYYLIA